MPRSMSSMFRRKRRQPKDDPVWLQPEIPLGTGTAANPIPYDLSNSRTQTLTKTSDDGASSARDRSMSHQEGSSTSVEREKADKRLLSLEERSKGYRTENVSSVEANNLGLNELIEKREWTHVKNREQTLASVQCEFELDGSTTRGYPLHFAVSKKPPFSVVVTMINAYPEATQALDEKWGRLPVHIACKYRASTDVVKLLLDSYPKAVQVADKAKRLPLHYACLCGYPYDVSMLVAYDKSALNVKDADGKTPIDLVNENAVSRRDAIMKRINEAVETKKTKRRKGKDKETSSETESRRSSGSSVPTLPVFAYPGVDTERNDSGFMPAPYRDAVKLSSESSSIGFAYMESPSAATVGSEVTVGTSNVTAGARYAAARKPTLPLDSRGRDDRAVTEELPSRRKRGSSLENPKRRRWVETKTKSSSSRSLEIPKSSRHKAGSSSSTDTRRRRKNRRRRLDSVPDNYDIKAPSTRGGRVEAQKMSETGSGRNGFSSLHGPPIDDDSNFRDVNLDAAPFVPNRKKKGLSDTNDFQKLTSKQTAVQSIPVLPLPLTGSRPEDSKPYEQPKTTKGEKKVHEDHKEVLPVPLPVETNMLPSLDHKRGQDRLPVLSESDELLSSEKAGQTSSERSSPDAQDRTAPESKEHREALAWVDSQIHSLELRKQALVEECNNVSETITRKRARAEMSRGKIADLKWQIIEMQKALEVEQSSLESAESHVQLHEEILAGHESKIKATNRELEALMSIRDNGTESLLAIAKEEVDSISKDPVHN